MRHGGEGIGTSADLETVAERNIRAGTRAPSPTVKSRRNPGQVFQEPPSNVVGFAVKCGKNLHPTALSSLSERRERNLPADAESKPSRLRRPYAISNWLVRGVLPDPANRARSDRGRWGAALARASSVFLRKMVIGDWNDPSTRLLDESVVQSFGISFSRLRRIPAERRTIEVGMSIQAGMIEMEKLDEATGRPEATVSLPIAPNHLRIAIEWPLPGAAGWTASPSRERKNSPWRIAPEELFDLEGKEKLDCSRWLGQQLVMFDRRGITLKDVIRMVATFEGAHLDQCLETAAAGRPEDRRSAARSSSPAADKGKPGARGGARWCVAPDRLLEAPSGSSAARPRRRPIRTPSRRR